MPGNLRILVLVAWIGAIVLQPAPKAEQNAIDAQTIRFRIIVVSSADAAESMLDRLNRGASFESLARAESIDPSAGQGGLVGPVALSDLRPELRNVLQALAPGANSPIVRIPLGYAIVQRLPQTGPDRRIGAGELGGLAAAGSVQPTVSVDGFVEANTTLVEFPKGADWNQDPREICRIRQQSLSEIVTAITRFADETQGNDKASAIDAIQAHVVLGQLHAYSGRMAEAIDQFAKARPRAARDFPDAVLQIEEMLGISYLHKSGLDNGVFRSPGDRCLLFPRMTPFATTGDSEKAIEYFTGILERRQQDFEVKWLLNLAYMTIGGYPGRVPQPHLIPPSTFESAESIGRFVDVAAEAGVDSFSSAGGVIVDDFDNDGSLEILTSNFDSCGVMHLFRRGTDGRFHDQAGAAGLSDQLGGLNLLQTDYNNDGCRDVLLLRGGWETAQRKSLLRNNCNGTFTDVTSSSGLATPATSTQTAVWTDIDNDGWVDLFVGNEDTASQLFRNKGDGTFEDIGKTAGIARHAFTKGVTAADIDNDGDPDLYVSNLGGGNFLYRNNGDRTFSEQAMAAGVPGADRGFPTWFFDYDNDGWEDLLVSSYYLSVDEIARSYVGLPTNANTMKLYKNLGNGQFRDVTASAKLDKVYMPMGSNFGDVDNDGFLDIFFGTGSPSYAATVRSVLLRNKDGRSFVDVTTSSGTGELHKGHGVAFADLDNDGDQEIVFKVGGATPGDAHAFRLFENPGNDNAWLTLNLVGVKTNRAAIGARITATVETETGERRTIHRTVNSGGSFGASPLEQHLGLGKVRRVDVEVWWPTSNTRQRFVNVARNQVIQIREMSDSYTVLKRPPAPLTARTGQRAPAGQGDANAR
jgi:hypothetical protein